MRYHHFNTSSRGDRLPEYRLAPPLGKVQRVAMYSLTRTYVQMIPARTKQAMMGRMVEARIKNCAGCGRL